MVRISIHAPREGGDGGIGIGNASRAISIHAPREGGDLGILQDSPISLAISIHAPREGGDTADNMHKYSTAISIHAPREGGDYQPFAFIDVGVRFQSTPPARGATLHYARKIDYK